MILTDNQKADKVFIETNATVNFTLWQFTKMPISGQDFLISWRLHFNDNGSDKSILIKTWTLNVFSKNTDSESFEEDTAHIIQNTEKVTGNFFCFKETENKMGKKKEKTIYLHNRSRHFVQCFFKLYFYIPGESQKHEFQAETKQLLDIVAKSLYSEKEVGWW